MENKKIYIMLSYTGTILSRIVKVCTLREYSHVSVALDLEFDSLYSFGRLQPRNPFSGGFVKEEIDGGTYKIFKNTRCKIFELEVTMLQYQNLKDFIDHFIDQSHAYKFNVVGLIGTMVNKPFNRENHYFCSQFVGKALLKSNIYDFGKDVGLIKPTEFAEIPGLKTIYQGKLSGYPSFLEAYNKGRS
ncbi:MAG: hypothetical protein JXR88_17035 [Clostridia bacterium]|nr:hypothetical protein [Clostridia bacterium]